MSNAKRDDHAHSQAPSRRALGKPGERSRKAYDASRNTFRHASNLVSETLFLGYFLFNDFFSRLGSVASIAPVMESFKE